MQGTVSDKILAPLNGKPLVTYSLMAFIESGIVENYILVYRDPAQKEALESAIASISSALQIQWVQGGSERQDSVRNALEAAQGSRFVFIHDAARPFVSPKALRSLNDAVQEDQAAVLAHPVNDTIKRLPDPTTLQKTKLEDLERNRLWAMETPQAFAYTDILKAYQKVCAEGRQITDDAAAALDIPITLVHNPDPNPKITTPSDFAYAEALLKINR